jgi:hypothetical protein
MWISNGYGEEGERGDKWKLKSDNEFLPHSPLRHPVLVWHESLSFNMTSLYSGRVLILAINLSWQR